MNFDAIERLEAWRNGDKSRCVEISIDDGYGGTCWVVSLGGTGGQLRMTEAEVGDDWPGLAATIHAALDKAEETGL